MKISSNTKFNLINRIFILFLVYLNFSLLFVTNGHAFAVTNNNSTVVMIYYSYTGNDGKTYSNIRTGIPVGTGDKIKYILTDGVSLDSKVTVKPDGLNAVSGTVLWTSKEKDFAILQLSSEINIRAAVFSSVGSSLKSVVKVTAVGYPVVNGQFPKNFVTTTASLTDTGDENGYLYYKTDTELSPGYTGGPLLDERGYVIGLNFSRPEFKGYGLAIQTEQLLPLLDQQGIKYMIQTSATPPTNTPQSSSSDNDTIIGIVLLVIILVIVLVGIGIIVLALTLVIKKSKKSKTPKITQTVHPHQQINFQSSQPSQQYYSQQNSFSSSSQAGTPVLRCISGIFSGNRMELNAIPILIGKDPRFCHIVYPSSENTIGEQHCTIRYDLSEHSFLLEDRGSTQGTFLISGERVLPGIPKLLKSGDRFFIGSPQNLFEVIIE